MKIKKMKIISIPKLVSSARCGYDLSFNDGTETVEYAVPIDYDRDLNNLFAVSACGDSMFPTIYDGDELIVDKNLALRKGSITVAMHNGNLTVKRYEQRGYSHYLVPENKKYTEEKITENTFIIGAVLTIRRDARNI